MFPTPQQLSGNGTPCFSSTGASLRDHFAGQVIVGILSNKDLLETVDFNSTESTRDAAAVYAYAVADSMLKARVK